MASEDENRSTSFKLVWLLPRLKAAQWIAGEIHIEPRESEVTVTALGERRFRELYEIQWVLWPDVFGECAKQSDGPARDGAKAMMEAIFLELDQSNPNVEGFHSAAAREFLMAYVRQVFKKQHPRL